MTERAIKPAAPVRHPGRAAGRANVMRDLPWLAALIVERKVRGGWWPSRRAATLRLAMAIWSDPSEAAQAARSRATSSESLAKRWERTLARLERFDVKY